MALVTSEPVPESGATSESGERKGQRTSRRILEAARAVFADLGYERATIRGIAAAAGVDKSSVIQYFGTKQNLFREAVHWTIPVADAIADTPEQTAENLARGMLAAWAADPNSPMAVLLRASMTSEDAAEILRNHITSSATPTLATAIDAPDARLRAALAGAMLMGIASQRYLLRMPDIADVDTEEILRLITPALRALIDPDSGPE
jgi:AcrR family transcriptional regulator